MEITLSIEDGSDGRLAGIARSTGPGVPEPLPFSGTLELLSVLERLHAAARPVATPPSDPDPTVNPLVTEQEHPR